MAIDIENSVIGAEDIISETEQLLKQSSEVNISGNLKIVLATREKLKERKASEIRFSEPVLKQGENAVIFPHTINVIQGQAGVHKSRLAENICAAFLKLNGNQNELLGFSRLNFNATHTVVYVDTERNLSEQLPFALQSIQMKAGYNRADHPSNFEYISLLQINRKDRFAALDEYLNHLKKSIQSPLFIVLDVSTDCIEHFNK
jgi:predicted ATPase